MLISTEYLLTSIDLYWILTNFYWLTSTDNYWQLGTFKATWWTVGSITHDYTATHSKAMSVWDWMDWILLRKLILLAMLNTESEMHVAPADCCPLLYIIVICCPLLSIYVHCYPLLSIVVHCFPLLSIVFHCCPLIDCLQMALSNIKSKT